MPSLKRVGKLVVPVVLLVVTALAAGPAIASDHEHQKGERDDEDEGAVAVQLSDFTNLPAVSWAVRATPSSTEENDVTFAVTNISLRIGHEFVVIKSDLPPGDLPRLGPGLGVDESRVKIVARLPVVPAGQSASLPLELDEGSYVLICNLNRDNPRSHYNNGMRTGFRVTDD